MKRDQLCSLLLVSLSDTEFDTLEKAHLCSSVYGLDGIQKHI
jgi:hypothetical protein